MIKPLVSAIVPVFNGEKYLAATLSSILSQTYENLEIIVVNDGSTDGTAAICSSIGDKIRYIQKSNAGVSAARNRGIAEASGKYIAFLDADDKWMPNKIERQVAALDGSGADLSLTAVKFIDSDDRVIGENIVPDPDTIIENLLTFRGDTGFIATTGLVSNKALERVGGFDEQLSTSADADMVFRLWSQYKILPLSEPLAMYRHHTGQMHHNLLALEHDANLTFKKFFAVKDLPERFAALESRAFASIETTLAIGNLRDGNYAAGISHLGHGMQLNAGATFSVLSRLIRSKLG